jgi:hypothetical protein
MNVLSCDSVEYAVKVTAWWDVKVFYLLDGYQHFNEITAPIFRVNSKKGSKDRLDNLSAFTNTYN